MEKDLLEVEKLHFNELRSSASTDLLDALSKRFTHKYTYESATIEGKNTLDLDCIENLLTKKVIVTQLSEREQKEVLNHEKAFKFIEKLVIQRIRLNEELLKDLHEILVDGIFVGGRYRQVNVQLKGSMHQPPDYVKVYDRMRKLFYDIDHFRGTTIQKAAFAHAGLYKIYPFLEGNGRMARLVLNYYLMFDGYLPISIPLEKQNDYFAHIDTFKVEKDLKPFANFVYQLLLNQYEEDIEFLEK